MDSVGLDSVLQVKPKLDPWQQKLLMELKEKKSVDELLKMHSRFLQVSVTSALTRSHTTIIYIIYIIMKRTQKSNKAPEVKQSFSLCIRCVCSGCHQVPDLLRVASALKAHAAHVADVQPAPTFSSPSRGSETRRHKTSEIWTSIYSAVSLTQAGIVQFVCSPPEAACLGNDVISKSDICLVRKHTRGQPDPEAEEVTRRRA